MFYPLYTVISVTPTNIPFVLLEQLNAGDMVDLGPHARVWFAVDLDHVESVAALPMLLGKPSAAGTAQKILLATRYALEPTRIRASPRMLLHLDERHYVVHAIVGDDVDLKPLVAATGADVAVDYLVAVDPQVLDRDIFAPCAVFDADVRQL